MDELITPFTFSRWCRSGLAEYLPNHCQCWRCRGKRGELATDETEQIAEQQAIVADAKYSEHLHKLLRDLPINDD